MDGGEVAREPAAGARGTPVPIGIAACSAAGAALCYRVIAEEGPRLLGGHAHPEITLHSQSLERYVARLERADLPGVAELLRGSVAALAAAGAGFVIFPDNTVHAALDAARPELPLPFLHIAEVVAAEAVRRGFRRVGITGTRWLVESEVYPRALAARGITCVRPGAEDRDALQRIIMDELVRGELATASVRRLDEVVGRLHAEGCDAVALACTELPLVLEEAASPVPLLDSTRLLARAALRRSIEAAGPA